MYKVTLRSIYWLTIGVASCWLLTVTNTAFAESCGRDSECAIHEKVCNERHYPYAVCSKGSCACARYPSERQR